MVLTLPLDRTKYIYVFIYSCLFFYFLADVRFIFDNTRQENILLGQTRRSGELFKLYDNHLNEVKMTKCTGQFSITLDIYKPVQLMDK